jgi:hypothetical protein
VVRQPCVICLHICGKPECENDVSRALHVGGMTSVDILGIMLWINHILLDLWLLHLFFFRVKSLRRPVAKMDKNSGMLPKRHCLGRFTCGVHVLSLVLCPIEERLWLCET